MRVTHVCKKRVQEKCTSYNAALFDASFLSVCHSISSHNDDDDDN